MDPVFVDGGGGMVPDRRGRTRSMAGVGVCVADSACGGDLREGVGLDGRVLRQRAVHGADLAAGGLALCERIGAVAKGRDVACRDLDRVDDLGHGDGYTLPKPAIQSFVSNRPSQLGGREFFLQSCFGTNRSATVGRSISVLCPGNWRICLGMPAGGKDGG